MSELWGKKTITSGLRCYSDLHTSVIHESLSLDYLNALVFIIPFAMNSETCENENMPFIW